MLVVMVGLKGQLAVALLAGILIGLAVNYAYFVLIKPPSGWHHVISFILASKKTEDLEIIHDVVVDSYPIVYNRSGPEFTISGDFWSIQWETAQYYTSPSYARGDSYLYYSSPSRLWVDKMKGYIRSK